MWTSTKCAQADQVVNEVDVTEFITSVLKTSERGQSDEMPSEHTLHQVFQGSQRSVRILRNTARGSKQRNHSDSQKVYMYT